jgi:hypothetical protein
MSASLLAGNEAVGENGADGLGGGIGAGGLGSLFAFVEEGTPFVAAEIASTIVLRNSAKGGVEADGLGGGLYIGNDAAADLNRSVVLRNRAIAGVGGQGVGGGIYNEGDLDLARSLVFANFATTSDDDCFGC